jgi:hypothetical protein
MAGYIRKNDVAQLNNLKRLLEAWPYAGFNGESDNSN